jgi:hypothetical protein
LIRKLCFEFAIQMPHKKTQGLKGMPRFKTVASLLSLYMIHHSLRLRAFA